ncbi:hypothetical protein KIN20_008885 [Parelaphostrongylus tenuis]|uniref:C2H2-type domain-containing protein n=1 Tax=Parelaphostrongylus tenuis TaxID=148309 RepID=A0AAD5QK56_PARTN|nr:hypothetical protein KIN20_008885 [Parelaphostrongylus tenuis]
MRKLTLTKIRKELTFETHISKVHDRALDGTKISRTFGCECGQNFGQKEKLDRHRYYCENREKIFEQRRRSQSEREEESELEAGTSSPVNSTYLASSWPNTASTSSAPIRPFKRT